MKKLLLCLGLCLSVTTFAQKKEWLDPELNAINRAPARADYFAYPSREMAEQGVREESSNFLSLNGMWKGSNRTACKLLSVGFRGSILGGLSGARNLGNEWIRRSLIP